MRGTEKSQQSLFSYVSPEQRVPKNHPLRPIRNMVDKALRQMHKQLAEQYSSTGRPSIPPEQLLRALLLQVFYTIRSERLLNTEIATVFFKSIRDQARQKDLMSDEHFTVDGTLLDAWASMKSFQPKNSDDGPGASGQGRNPTVDFHGQKRKNDTHASKTDSDARLYKKAKGQQARLCYMGHTLMENRNGLVVDAMVTITSGTAERDAAEMMLDQIPGCHRITLGADKGYDCKDFVKNCRQFSTTAHVAQKEKDSAIDRRTTRHQGYSVSLRIRKRVEEVFGWLKTVGCMRKLHHRGCDRVDAVFTLATAAYNLIRMRNLTAPGCT